MLTESLCKLHVATRLLGSLAWWCLSRTLVWSQGLLAFQTSSLVSQSALPSLWMLWALVRSSSKRPALHISLRAIVHTPTHEADACFFGELWAWGLAFARFNIIFGTCHLASDTRSRSMLHVVSRCLREPHVNGSEVRDCDVDQHQG